LTYAKFTANHSAVNPKASTLQLFIDNSSAVKRQNSSAVQRSTQKQNSSAVNPKASTLQPFSSNSSAVQRSTQKQYS